MKRLLVISLIALSGCGQVQSIMSPHGDTAAAKPTSQLSNLSPSAGGPVGYAGDNAGCSSLARSRLALFDRPDTYPISAQEKQGAYQALYAACMRGHNWQVAAPVHKPAAPTGYATGAELGNLSPSAGGGKPANTVIAGNTIVSTSNIPGATVVVIGGSKEANAAQLSSMSPSSGGSSAHSNATVVYVQPQQQAALAAPTNAYPYPSSAPLPVAVPITQPPVVKSHAHAPKAQVTPPAGRAPIQTMGTTPMGYTLPRTITPQPAKTAYVAPKPVVQPTPTHAAPAAHAAAKPVAVKPAPVKKEVASTAKAPVVKTPVIKASATSAESTNVAAQEDYSSRTATRNAENQLQTILEQ